MKYEDYCEFEKYADVEGTEIGDYTRTLCSIHDFTTDHGMSVEFEKALTKEMYRWLKEFKDNYQFVEEAVPQPDKVYKSLEYIG